MNTCQGQCCVSIGQVPPVDQSGGRLQNIGLYSLQAIQLPSQIFPFILATVIFPFYKEQYPKDVEGKPYFTPQKLFPKFTLNIYPQKVTPKKLHPNIYSQI